VNTNKFNVTAASGNTTVAGTFGVTGTSALTGNVTLSGTLTGPSSGSFAVDAGGAIPLNLGGTTATTLNLRRTGQTQALLGNATIAGTLQLQSFTAGALKTNATGQVSAVAPGTAGNVLTSTGTDFVSQVPDISVFDKSTATVAVANTTTETTLYSVN